MMYPKSKLLENAQSENPEFMYHNIIRRYQDARRKLLDVLMINLDVSFKKGSPAVLEFIEKYHSQDLAETIISRKILRQNLNRLNDAVLEAELELHYNEAVKMTLADSEGIKGAVQELESIRDVAFEVAKLINLSGSFVDFIGEAFISNPESILSDLSIFDRPKQMNVDLRWALDEVWPNRISRLKTIEIEIPFADFLEPLAPKLFESLRKLDMFCARNTADVIGNILIKIVIQNDVELAGNNHSDYEEWALSRIADIWKFTKDRDDAEVDPAFGIMMSKLKAKNIIVVNQNDSCLWARYYLRLATIDPIETKELKFFNLDREVTAYKLHFESSPIKAKVDVTHSEDEDYDIAQFFEARKKPPKSKEITQPIKHELIQGVPTRNKYPGWIEHKVSNEEFEIAQDGLLEEVYLTPTPGACDTIDWGCQYLSSEEEPVPYNSTLNEQILFWSFVCKYVGNTLSGYIPYYCEKVRLNENDRYTLSVMAINLTDLLRILQRLHHINTVDPSAFNDRMNAIARDVIKYQSEIKRALKSDGITRYLFDTIKDGSLALEVKIDEIKNIICEGMQHKLESEGKFLRYNWVKEAWEEDTDLRNIDNLYTTKPTRYNELPVWRFRNDGIRTVSAYSCLKESSYAKRFILERNPGAEIYNLQELLKIKSNSTKLK